MSKTEMDSPSLEAGDDKVVADGKGAEVEHSVSHSMGEIEPYIVDKELEKKVLRKFDIYILPSLAIMYLFKYVSRP